MNREKKNRLHSTCGKNQKKGKRKNKDEIPLNVNYDVRLLKLM